MFCHIFCIWLLGKERHHLHPPKLDLTDQDLLPNRLGKDIQTLLCLGSFCQRGTLWFIIQSLMSSRRNLRDAIEELTNFVDGNIDIAIVKEFYANLYDPEDKSPKQGQTHLWHHHEDGFECGIPHFPLDIPHC